LKAKKTAWQTGKRMAKATQEMMPETVKALRMERERLTGMAMETGMQRARPTEMPMEKTTEREMERAMEKATEREMEKEMEKEMEWAMEKVTEKVSGSPPEEHTRSE
jgi:hypothetical protein